MKEMSYKRRLNKKQKSRIVIGLLLTVALISGVLACLSWWENHSQAQLPSSSNEEISSGKELNVDGVTYVQRRKVESYLFIGVDMNGEATGVDSYIQGGQGDVQMLLTIDNLNRTWQILQLNRDSMVNVPVLGIQGNVVSSEFQQLCMAHSYGSGREDSCENNVNTVSDLLNGQKINGYFAMNMDGIGILNDLVGGVTVNVTSDFSAVDSTLTEGSTITLNAQQAEEFVRTRRDVDDETNISRMSRQREFMSGLMNAIDGKGTDFVQDAYSQLSSYTVTDLSEKTLSKIFTKTQKYSEQDILTIDGNLSVEDDHWVYYLDQNSLNQTMIQLFYEKKEGD